MPLKKAIESEADIQSAVTDLLLLDGWRAIRTDPVSDRARGKGFGEVGMPDYLYFRYKRPDYQADLLWIEFKRPGGKLKQHQQLWAFSERQRGATVLTVDSVDLFLQWYATSGLSKSFSKK